VAMLYINPDSVYEMYGRLHGKFNINTLIDYTCKVCKKEPKMYGKNKDLYEAYSVELPDGVCMSCNHWQEIHNKQDRHVVIDKVSYYDSGLIKPHRGFMGHSGRIFSYQYLNDKEVVISTNDLWCQGNIPETWQSKIKDNAVWHKLNPPSTANEEVV